MSDNNTREKTNEIRIKRVRHGEQNPYFLLARAAAQDTSLSYEARGMLVYLLSKPDHWKVQPSDLQQKCGKNRVYRILNDLIEAGYIERIYERDDKTKQILSVIYNVYEEPFPQNQEMALQEMANSDIREYRDIDSTDIAGDPAEDVKPTKSKKQTTIPAAQMNPMKDAIAAAFGIDWQSATKNEIGTVQKAAKELCEAGRVPENVAIIYRYCEKQFSSAFTPMALTKHATAAMNEHEAQTTRHAKAQQETIEEVSPEVRQANAAAMRKTLNKMRQEASA